MHAADINRALTRLGETADLHVDVDVLLVGGAAGMLTGILPPSRVTTDCDVMVYEPAFVAAELELAAEQVARELDLPPRWFNSDVRLRADALPKGWRNRRVPIDHYGRLRVYAISRQDLLAMKVLAGRTQDLEDIREMRPRADEIAFVRAELESRTGADANDQEALEALGLLDALEPHDER